MIAGAIALDPWLIVADEPVASLDASVRGEILRLMLGLVQETEVAMLVVTHDLGLAWNVADRIAVMYLGRIVELGTTEEVLEDPKHPYTRALLSVVPEIEHMEPQILPGEPPDPTKIPDGCRFHPRCPVVASGEAARLGILERCQTEDPSASGCGPVTPRRATPRPPTPRTEPRRTTGACSSASGCPRVVATGGGAGCGGTSGGSGTARRLRARRARRSPRTRRGPSAPRGAPRC